MLANGFTVTSGVTNFNDVGTAPLCVEPDYQLANAYIESIDATRSTKINRVNALFEDCFAGVGNGTFKAFVTDGPMLRHAIERDGRTDLAAVDQNSEIYYAYAFLRENTLMRESVVRCSPGT